MQHSAPKRDPGTKSCIPGTRPSPRPSAGHDQPGTAAPLRPDPGPAAPQGAYKARDPPTGPFPPRPPRPARDPDPPLDPHSPQPSLGSPSAARPGLGSPRPTALRRARPLPPTLRSGGSGERQGGRRWLRTGRAGGAQPDGPVGPGGAGGGARMAPGGGGCGREAAGTQTHRCSKMAEKEEAGRPRGIMGRPWARGGARRPARSRETWRPSREAPRAGPGHAHWPRDSIALPERRARLGSHSNEDAPRSGGKRVPDPGPCWGKTKAKHKPTGQTRAGAGTAVRGFSSCSHPWLGGFGVFVCVGFGVFCCCLWGLLFFTKNGAQ